MDVFFDTMSDFNVPGSRPKKTRSNFGNRPNRLSPLERHLARFGFLRRFAPVRVCVCVCVLCCLRRSVSVAGSLRPSSEYVYILLIPLFFDPAGLPYKYLVFAPEVDRRSSRDFEWTDL